MNLALARSLAFGVIVVAAACSSQEGAVRPPGGGTGSTTGTSGHSGLGVGGGQLISFGGSNGDPNVMDPDPTNPKVVHPACAAGTCMNFPDMPLLGDGVPANAPTLFGADPTKFSSGLCVLEPQLSSGSTPGTMIPANWLRPRFRFAGTGLDLFEIRIHNASQKNDLVAYTKKTTWYLPKDIWTGMGASIAAGNGVANNGADYPFTVTIRGINSASPGTPVGVSGDFLVAPVVATGSMVFWTVKSAVVTPTSSRLLGFAVGDEGVAEALSLKTVKWGNQMAEDGSVLRGYYDKPKLADFTDGQVRCIGCHTSTPDGTAVVFTDDWPWPKAAASVAMGSVGQIPTTISAGAQALLKMPWWGTQSMSLGHWKTGDHIMVTSYGYKTNYNESRDKAWYSPPYDSHKDASGNSDVKLSMHQLAWIDMDSTATINVAVTDNPDYGQPLNDRNMAAQSAKGTGWGIIATGDTDSAVSPNLSHDGNNIVYTTTDKSPDGHPDYTATRADVKVVPYSKTGGTGKALAGASDPAFLEYYPSYSADDKLIAFTRAPTPSATNPDGPYYNRNGEIMVIPAAGGTATRLVANDANACAGDMPGHGLINSWPKWSPDAVVARKKTYYFVIFSSARKYADEFSEQFQLPSSSASSFKGLNDSSQLWLAAVVVDESGAITTYPAQYIWNQNREATTGGGDGTKIQYSNLTPAWDPFVLPPIVITQVPEDIPR